MDQKTFVKAIQNCRRRLSLAGFLSRLVSALCIGAIVGILFQVVSFMIPLYYARLYAVVALFLALATAAVVAYVKRTGMEQAALVMDSFGFEERIVTAYGNLEKEGALIELQRADAMRQLLARQDNIRIALLPPWKKTGTLLGLLAVLSVLALLPAEMKDRAEKMHNARQEAKEKVEEIGELVEALEQLAQEELAPEQQALLQEMTEALQISQSEFLQASSDDMVQAATEKLNYRYEDVGSQLAELAQSLQNGAAVSPVTEASLQALAEKMQGLGGAQFAQGNTGQSGQNGGQNGQPGSNGNQGGNGQNGSNGSQSGNGQPGSNGNQGGNGQSGNQGGNGQNGNGQSGNQGGNGQNDSGGQNGNGGQNGGSGNGGSGSGRGTGTSSTPHDYVSVPNDIADSGNLTGNAVDHSASEYFRGQNGLSWEGTHISHEAVIGSYEQNAYEGIAAGKYPSGMEEIIKEYFSNFN